MMDCFLVSSRSSLVLTLLASPPSKFFRSVFCSGLASALASAPFWHRPQHLFWGLHFYFFHHLCRVVPAWDFVSLASVRFQLLLLFLAPAFFSGQQRHLVFSCFVTTAAFDGVLYFWRFLFIIWHGNVPSLKASEAKNYIWFYLPYEV